MTLIQEIINRRLFDEDQKYRSSVLKNEWISRQSRNILASLLIVSSLLQLMLSVVLVLQNAVFSLFIFICLLIPSLQAVIVLTSHRSSSVLISAPILKISLMAHILVGIVYSLFMIANIEGLIPMVHRPWLTGTDAANLLIQKYVAFPILSDTSASLWMPHEKLNLLQSISLDAYLWVRVSFLQVLFAALIVISFFISIVALVSLSYRKGSYLVSLKASATNRVSKTSVSQKPANGNYRGKSVSPPAESAAFSPARIYSPEPKKIAPYFNNQTNPNVYVEVSL